MKPVTLVIILAVLSCLVAELRADGPAPPGGGNTSFYASVPTAYMDDPRRAEWQKPEKVLDYLLIRPGDVIADIGAGTGYFSMQFARRVGKGGMVYAVDVDPQMIAHIERRARKEGAANVRGVLAPMDDPGIPKATADLIFICDTFLFFDNREDYLLRLRDRLKGGGRVAIVSFNYRAEIPGAPPRHKMVSKEQTVAEMEKAGFIQEADLLFLPYQDFLIFAKR